MNIENADADDVPELQRVATQRIVDALERRGLPVSLAGRRLAEASGDFGRMARGRPQAVVVARDTSDVRDVLRVAADLGTTVIPRGNGGNTAGQTVRHQGIVLDLRGLRGIAFESDAVVLGAGTPWSHAIDAIRRHSRLDAAPRQLAVVPGYKKLTVGGTLSIGGGGFRSHARGLQVDHVRSLEVVTGAGDVCEASPEHNRDLFYAVLGGGGQSGVITRASMTLVPDEYAEGKRLGSYVLAFRDQEAFLDAMLDPELAASFYEVQGNARPRSGGWEYLIKGSVDRHRVSTQALRSRFPAAHVRRVVHAWVRSGRYGRLQSGLYDAGLRAIGRWNTPHPWGVVYLPLDETRPFFRSQLARIPTEGFGRFGFVTLVPTRHLRRPYSFLALPPGDNFGSFGVFCMPRDRAQAQPLREHVDRMQREAASCGGMAYLSDAIPFTPEGWRRYYGERLPEVLALKQTYDPNRVLEPLHASQGVVLGNGVP